MQIKFEVVIEPHEHKDLLPYTNALERDSFLFEIFHNLKRKWRHSDIEPTLEEVMEEIYELKEKFKVIIE